MCIYISLCGLHKRKLNRQCETDTLCWGFLSYRRSHQGCNDPSLWIDVSIQWSLIQYHWCIVRTSIRIITPFILNSHGTSVSQYLRKCTSFPTMLVAQRHADSGKQPMKKRRIFTLPSGINQQYEKVWRYFFLYWRKDGSTDTDNLNANSAFTRQKTHETQQTWQGTSLSALFQKNWTATLIEVMSIIVTNSYFTCKDTNP